MERKYAWHNYDDATMEKVYALSDTYRQFLDNGKTERECVVQAVEFAEAKGYVNLNDIIKSNTSIKAGDKIYYTHMDKSIALFNIGTDDIELGMNILGAHIDSPRIDVMALWSKQMVLVSILILVIRKAILYSVLLTCCLIWDKNKCKKMQLK